MKRLYKICIVIPAILLAGCRDMLELPVKNKIPGSALFADPEGVKQYMANIYAMLPIEDFNYMRDGFNGWIGENMVSAMFTEEATHSEYQSHLTSSDFGWKIYNPTTKTYREFGPAYSLIRTINILEAEIPGLKITEAEHDVLVGEAAFAKAFTYMALAMRYGGVPIIEDVQIWEGDIEKLKVPRSTEKATWDYVMGLFDIAADNLPLSWDGDQRRATRYVALAYKTRAALHAASIAKFGDRISLAGEAVTQGLVGIPAEYADTYYEQCIVAADEIINSGRFALFGESKANLHYDGNWNKESDWRHVAENYRLLFAKPNDSEALKENMFIKGYTHQGQGHSYEIYYGPNQTANGWPHPGRMNPNLELMDAYESYAAPGSSSVLITSDAADDADDYGGFRATKNYKKYDTPYGIFEEHKKDARLWGSVILPGTQWKGTTIVIQAGYIDPSGTPVIFSGNPFEKDGKTYYVFGAANNTEYSGFDVAGGNHTRTGASFKKFLDEENPVVYGYRNGLNDWVDMRFAEVLLNYAEAVVECGSTQQGSAATAANALNRVRKRAGHNTDIALTPENVQRERLVELAFENRRFWDMMRRREYHTLRVNHEYHALLPVLDLREATPKYIFIRSKIQRIAPFTFWERMYYHAIPGTADNGLIQNPQY